MNNLPLTPASINLRNDIRLLVRQTLKPMHTGSLSEWADKNRYVGSGAFQGVFETSRVPYFREIMDAIGDTATERIVVMAAAQNGKTTCCIENPIGFFMSQQPTNIMLVCADKDSAKSFSEQKLTPMIEQSPTLRSLIKHHRTRDSGNRVNEKTFPGGYVVMVSAKSAHSLRARSIQVLLMDEIDAYDSALKKEGSPIALAEERTNTYPNRKIVMTSTPTVAELSAIEKYFKAGTQEYFHIPCPQCGHFQKLQWGGRDKAYGMKWDGDDPETAYYLCNSGNGCLFHESDVFQAVHRGKWIAENPGAPSGYRSFHINALYSPFAGNDWPKLVARWLEARRTNNRESLREFINLVLAETFDDEAMRLSSTMLERHIIPYDADCPSGVGIITAAVDVQDDRLECYIYGWGDKDIGWLIDREIIHHDPSYDTAWRELDQVLMRTYQTKKGVAVGIRAVNVDTGHKAETVYRYVKGTRALWDSKGINKTIKAVKGASTDTDIIGKVSHQKSIGIDLHMIGTAAAKDFLFNWLHNSKAEQQYLYLPEFYPEAFGQSRVVDKETLEQYTSEKSRRFSGTNGRVKREWVKIRNRNEALDCLVYAYHAFLALGPQVTQHVGALAVKLIEMEPDGSQKPVNMQRQQPTINAGIKYYNKNPLLGGNWNKGW